MLGEVMIFEPVIIHNYLQNEFDSDYAPIAIIQYGAPIEFKISGARQLYCDMNNLFLRVRERVLKAANRLLEQIISNCYKLFVQTYVARPDVKLYTRCTNELNYK